jgi:4-aminobutyrate aminotransferase-like enzyme
VSPDEVAAVMVEAIRGGGYVVPAAQFHQRLRTTKARHPRS